MASKKNAFSFFLDYYIDEARQKGRIMSKRIAAEECSPLWQKLPANKKQFYVDLAKAFKSEQCCRQPQQQIQNGKRDHSQRYSQADLRYIQTHITTDAALRTHSFYIVHCNYYCKTEEGSYIPAELAISEFSLKEGIERTYHAIVDPGELPLGYAYDARRLSHEIHGLPLPPYKEGKCEYVVLAEILQFLNPSKTGADEYPPLFTIENNVIPTMNILETLYTIEYGESESPFKVFPIHKVFFWLQNKCTESCGSTGSGFPVLASAITEIEKDVFRYCSGISCDFHNNCPERYQNCSLSVVKRLAYIICDHCCRHLNIELIGGKHVHHNFLKKKQRSVSKPIFSDTSSLISGVTEREAPDYSGASSYASSVIAESIDETVQQTIGYGAETSEIPMKRLEVAYSDQRDEEGTCLDDGDSSDSSDDGYTIVMSRGRGRQLERAATAAGLAQHKK